jgi:hypothetical protein
MAARAATVTLVFSKKKKKILHVTSRSLAMSAFKCIYMTMK